MMPLMETIRAYLGWCPMAGSMRTELAVRPVTTVAAGGRDCIPRTEPGWWNRYHNQLLVAAIAFSAAAVAAFLLVEDAPGYPTMWTGLGIGVGAVIGLLLGCRKQYARIAAGEFIRANMTPGLRIVRRLSMPMASILLVFCVAFFVREGLFGQVLALVLGLSLAGWASYGITVLWERRHSTTLIAEKGSMYTLDAAMQEEPVWR